jgi:hypothetical protein
VTQQGIVRRTGKGVNRSERSPTSRASARALGRAGRLVGLD